MCPPFAKEHERYKQLLQNPDVEPLVKQLMKLRKSLGESVGVISWSHGIFKRGWNIIEGLYNGKNELELMDFQFPGLIEKTY